MIIGRKDSGGLPMKFRDIIDVQLIPASGLMGQKDLSTSTSNSNITRSMKK